MRGREIPGGAWRHRRALELVKILALARNHRLATDQVIDLLWPDLSPQAGAANLRKAAHFARAVLGAADAVVLSDRAVALAPGGDLEVDAEEFERAADAAARTQDDAAWRAALGLYAGDLLPDDPYAEWAAGPRERLRLKHLEGLRRLGMWERLAEEEPLDEEAHRGLMRMWLERGNRHAAVRAFDRLQDLLLRELGVRPSPETIALWSEIKKAPPALPVAPTPLVGRETEIERALGRWDEARDGRGGVVLVSGEAGIGKTRLCEELARVARADGAAVVVGAAEEASSPFAAILTTLDAAFAEQPGLGDALGQDARERLVMPAGEASGLPWLEASTPGVERQRMFSSVARTVTAAAAEHGLLLVLEDVHLADDSSLQLLTYLGRIAPYHPVLLVLSQRSETLVPELAVLRSTLLAGPRCTDLRLGRLAPDEVAKLVLAASAGRASKATVESIWQLGEGNPFYCEELAAATDADGSITIPDRLYEVLTVRLERVAQPVREALQRVAVTGDRFTADEFTAVVGIDDVTAFGYLDEAILAGVIDEHGTGYRFRHTLLRRALERSLPRHRRRRIHAEMAERLGVTGSDPARVAHHLAEAGQADASLPWLEKAAVQAASLGAYADALRFATDASARATVAEDLARLLALRADLLYVTGDPAAVTAYDVAVATAPAESRPRLSLMKARAQLATGDIEGAGHTVDHVQPVTAEDQIAAAVVRGLVTWAGGSVDAAEQAAWAARDLAMAAGHAAGLGEASELLGLVAHSRGQWRERVRYELTDTARRPEAVAGSVFDAHLCLAEYLLYGQQPYDDVIDFASDLRATAVRSGAGRGEAFATCLLGEAELLSGRLDEALDHLERAAHLHEVVAASAGQALSLQRLAETALAAGDAQRAMTLLEEAERAAQGSTLERHLLGKVYGTMVQAQRDPRRAMTVVDRAEAQMSDQLLCEPCAMGFFVAAAMAAARTNDLDRARGYLRRAEEVSAHWTGGAWHAAVLEARSAVAAAEGDADAAARLLERAAATFDRAGQRLDAERCRLAAAA
ncbi:ATP-binding protein [Promicromonospora sp. NPDC057138]|uniref:ATP-binding protein n=1 Tax=Promicromonospora sp. NPDC057138 TaxID=3346031 RepID=UPI00362F25F0